MAEFAKRFSELKRNHVHEKSTMRRESTMQPRGGRQQIQGYDEYYGVATQRQQQQQQQQQRRQTPDPSPLPQSSRSREEDMVYDHAHTRQQMRRQSTYQPLSGRSQHGLYEKYYDESRAQLQQQREHQQQQRQSQVEQQQLQKHDPSYHVAGHSRPRSPVEEQEYARLAQGDYSNPEALPVAGNKSEAYGQATRKAQLRERYEYRMHNDPNREIFACTMNNNKPGTVLRSGVLSVLPRNSGPKKVDAWAARTPDRAGGLPLHVIAAGGDSSKLWRPHEKRVKPHFEPGHAGQSSHKLALNKRGHGRRQYSPEMHQRIHKHAVSHVTSPADSGLTYDGEGSVPMGNFPWNSPDAELVRNHKLRSIRGPGSDHTHDIICPDPVNPIDAILDPSSVPKAPVWAELSGKRGAYTVEHQERVNPSDTQDRLFGAGLNGGDQSHHDRRHMAAVSLRQRKERFGF